MKSILMYIVLPLSLFSTKSQAMLSAGEWVSLAYHIENQINGKSMFYPIRIYYSNYDVDPSKKKASEDMVNPEAKTFDDITIEFGNKEFYLKFLAEQSREDLKRIGLFFIVAGGKASNSIEVNNAANVFKEEIINAWKHRKPGTDVKFVTNATSTELGEYTARLMFNDGDGNTDGIKEWLSDLILKLADEVSPVRVLNKPKTLILRNPIQMCSKYLVK